MNEITLISGGIKSGKSDFAEFIASKYKNISYVALSEKRPNDKHWQKKILTHKLKRPKNWKTIETDDLLSVLVKENDILLIDSIGGFVVKNLHYDDNEWYEVINKLILLMKNYKEKIIIVAEQVGCGLISEYKIGNKFAERQGEILKEITKISNNNFLAINGRAVRLDDLFLNGPN